MGERGEAEERGTAAMDFTLGVFVPWPPALTLIRFRHLSFKSTLEREARQSPNPGSLRMVCHLPAPYFSTPARRAPSSSDVHFCLGAPMADNGYLCMYLYMDFSVCSALKTLLKPTNPLRFRWVSTFQQIFPHFRQM